MVNINHLAIYVICKVEYCIEYVIIYAQKQIIGVCMSAEVGPRLALLHRHNAK